MDPSSEIRKSGAEHLCTPERSSYVVDISEAINAFSDIQLIESPRSSYMNRFDELSTSQKRSSSHSRLKAGAKGRYLFPVVDKQEYTLWTDEEVYALTLFLMLHTDGKRWVTHKDMKFWDDAGGFIHKYPHTTHCRTGVSCRSKVTKILQIKFASPTAAEKHYIALLSASAEKTSRNSDAQVSCSTSSLETSTFSAQTATSVSVTPLSQIVATFPSSALPTPTSFSIPTIPVSLHAMPATFSIQQLPITPTKLSQSVPAMLSVPLVFSFSTSVPSVSSFSVSVPVVSSVSLSVPGVSSVSLSVPGIPSVSTTVPGVSSFSLSVPRVSSFLTSVPRVPTLSTTVPGISSFSPSVFSFLTSVPRVPSLSTTVPGVSSFLPSVPGVSSFLPSVPGVSSFLPSVPAVSSFLLSVPGVSSFSPSVPGISSFSPSVFSFLTSVPRVPSMSTTVPGVSSLSSFSVATSSFSTMSLSLQQLFAMPYQAVSSALSSPSTCSSRPHLRQDPDVEQVLTACWQYIKSLQPNQQCKVLSDLFDLYVQQSTTLKCTPNFIALAVNGMIHLKECKRSNVICSLARSLGTLRPDESDSLLPAKRMPMSLIEYCINFFNSSSVQQVCFPSDYQSWLETMYVLFGTKWCKIFSGPLWSHGHPEQVTAAHKNGTHSDPTEAFVNVPALSDRTIRRDIAASDFTTGPDIQMGILKRLATLDPTMGWWIKGDGTDVVKGLWESASGEWAGDVDLNDGKLAAQYKQYQDKITWLKGIGLRNGNIEDIKQDLLKAQDDISTEIDFVLKELQKANDSYHERLTAGSTSDQTIFSLSWDVQELKNIDLECRQVYSELRHCIDSCRPESFQEQNIPRRLVDIRQKLCKIIKRILHYRRTPATHVFVIMISSESRNKKPYALPVQCIPYSGLKEVELRRLISGLCKEMTTLGMKVSGFASDGECNYLRTKGYTRPLSVFQVWNDVRKIYSKMSMRKMLAMITPKGQLPNESIQAEDSNSIVPECVLCLIWLLRRQGISFQNIVQRLQPRTVPTGYAYHNWTAGKTEGFEDQLRSILAQFHFAYEIHRFEAQGVPFRTYLYVPEQHPQTKNIFYEREDEAHLIKRIANHTRNGGPSSLNLERYTEALSDPSSGLTYPAFVGSRKQSVTDAERLFSPRLAAFMDAKGYHYEAEYIKTVWNWRRASDEHRLSSLKRCQYNYQMLNLILEDLMPWYKECYDFSQLEVNRNLNDVLGFSKETLVAVTTNIESREHHRKSKINSSFPLEHPRASSTDDIECFFSVMRDIIGKNFTTKEFKFGMRKVVPEFSKRVDPDLPFYYYTSAHSRYYEGPHPDFDKAPAKQPKEKRIPRREQPAAFGPRRATMPVRGSLAVRPKFHNVPLDLPPPPTGPIVSHEHSYAQPSTSNL